MKYSLLFFFILVLSSSTFAATFTVTNLNDSGSGTLRQAISDAGIAEGNDVINFQNGLTGSINLTSGELLIDSNVSISGNSGITVARSIASDAPNFRILNVTSNATISISSLTISGNMALALRSLGGGIYNSNVFNLTGSAINNNLASQTILTTPSSGAGGGILNLGQLNVSNSTVSNDKSTGKNYLANPYGGGIFSDGQAIIRNSTVSGNTQNTVTSDPSHELGGGIRGGYLGAIIISNSIIAGNIGYYGNSDVASDTKVQSEGSNLIGRVNNSSGWVASDILNIDPKLAALADNGGFTQTQALLAGSPAINAGNNQNAPATDQRGFARIVGGVIDIGAYESDFISATPTPSPTPIPSPSPSPSPTPSPTPTLPPPAFCSYSAAASNQPFSPAGGNGSINVTASSGCPVQAFTNDFFIVVNSDGSNGGAVTFTVGRNSGAFRQGKIYIGNLIITIDQFAGTPKSRTRVKFF